MRQITSASRSHLLTNTSIWTPDGRQLVSDARPSGASFTGETIERVDVHTGKAEAIHHASQGACVDVVTVHTKSEKYIFIHGPENPDETWHYDSHHRCGMIVENDKVSDLDTMDITVPCAPGALYDGSHVHVFSPNDEKVSFAYNDYVMYELDPVLGLWNVGVAALFGPVNAQKQHPREYSGSHWCVLVSKTTPMPQPNSGEISRAYEEGWIGNHALAFISDTLSAKGEKMLELLIVELPQDEAGWKTTGDAPSSGTETTLPTPPRGVVRRRLALTRHRAYPGLANVPRHWVRRDPQGTQAVFLMRDDNGIAQLWLISPQGGEPRQLTHNKTGTQSAFDWHPSGE